MGVAKQLINVSLCIVTHVVCSCDENMCCTRTVKCLSAITTGRWLVDYQCKCVYIVCIVCVCSVCV